MVGRRTMGALGVVAVAFVAVAFAAAAGGNHGKVGTTVTVKGQTTDAVAVTVGKIQDPLLAYSSNAGMRTIGITFTIKSVGKGTYNGTASAYVSTVDGEISGSEITGGGPCDPPAVIKLAPGQSKTFCQPFQIGKSAKLAFIQVETDSGYGTPAVFSVK